MALEVARYGWTKFSAEETSPVFEIACPTAGNNMTAVTMRTRESFAQLVSTVRTLSDSSMHALRFAFFRHDDGITSFENGPHHGISVISDPTC